MEVASTLAAVVSNLAVTAVFAGLGLAVLVCAAIALLLRLIATGQKIYLLSRRVYYRVYIFPQDAQVCKALSDIVAYVSKLTLGEPLSTYPIVQNARGAFDDKIVIVAYDAKTDAIAGFQACIVFDKLFQGCTALHLGLFMVLPAYRGVNIQKWLGFLSMWAVVYVSKGTRFFVTDLGASAPGTRAFCDIFENVYPHYRGYDHVQRQPYHEQVAQYLVSHYRAHTGISTLAKFDEANFVVRGSNMAEGGGAHQLVGAVKCNQTTTRTASDFLAKHIDVDAGDEIVHVGTLRLLPFLLRPLSELFRHSRK